MIYKAAAALSHDDRSSATQALRGQLRVMAVAAGATPDWQTLQVIGPMEMAGAEARSRFEWTASVDVRGVALPDPDLFLVPDCPGLADTAVFRLASLAA